MAYFDRFDICEAYLALETDYNIGGILYPRERQVWGQLCRIGFSPGLAFNGYESLTENGKEIYNNWVEKNVTS